MIALTNNIFRGSKKRGLVNITLGSAIPSSGITVQAASPSNNLVIAQSDGSYTITTDDEDLVTSADEDYYVDLVNSILVLKEA